MKTVFSAVSIAVLMASAAVAGPVTYIVNLSGPAESPPNASPGTGFATVILDTSAHTLFVDISFSGLIGTTTASHIHCCTPAPDTGTAGVATITPTFTGFPLGVTSGTYTHTYDTSAAVGTWNPAFIAANGGTALSAEAVFAAGLAAGESYFNIHTSFAPGGEIRGFLIAPPTLSKAFADPILSFSQITKLSFTVTNPNASASLSGVGFTDTLPSGLQVYTPNGLTGSCGGGTITAVAGGNFISLSGATLAGGAVCTFSVDVIGITDGVQVNTTSAVTSTNGGTGAAATASTSVQWYMLYLWWFS